MNVYAETNLLLEIACDQEESASAAALLDADASGSLSLFVPAFSVSESVTALARRDRTRSELYERLTNEVRDLSQSAPFRDEARSLRDASKFLKRAGGRERSALKAVLRSLLSRANVVPLDAEIIERSARYRGLSPQDSIVFASVIAHLDRTRPPPSVFVTRNSSDFGSDDLVAELQRFGCKALFHFDDALELARRPSA